MRAWSVGKMVKVLVVVAVLFFVLFFGVDLLYLSLSPLGRFPEDFYDQPDCSGVEISLPAGAI